MRNVGIAILATGIALSGVLRNEPLSAQPPRSIWSGVYTESQARRGEDLYATQCARCHGANGISTTKGVPHLAGQRPAYLHFELRAYQSGARDDKAMIAAVRFLSDDALVKVSAYYASLEPARPSAASARASITQVTRCEGCRARIARASSSSTSLRAIRWLL